MWQQDTRRMRYAEERSAPLPGNAPAITGTRLKRSVIWNMLGTILPMLMGLIAVPVLIEQLGAPRFGVVTLVWMVVGYFSLFDLGLGRALTHVVAEKLGRGASKEIPEFPRSCGRDCCSSVRSVLWLPS
jgi:hypothetical protein